jgi:hypothetical protein
MRTRVAAGTWVALVALVAPAFGAASCGSSSSGFHPVDGGPGADGTPSICANNDCDGDGYSSPADCNDSNALINPEAYDFPGDGVDDDCDGKVDDPVEHCETLPATPPGTPDDFARAADICAQNSVTHAGTVFDPLVHASWGQVQGLGPGQRLWTSQTKPTIQTNIVSSFGMNATREGPTMVGLANGPWGAPDPRSSAALDDPMFHINDACADIPLMGQDCASLSNGAPAGGVNVQDWAELSLTVQVPSNVQAVTFDFSFLSSEFNQWWNAAANDAFFVLVTSNELQGANVAKDAHGLAVSVNSSFFQLCPAPPGPAGLSQDKAAAIQSCVGLDGDMSQQIQGSVHGTGYDGAAASTDDTVHAMNGNLYVYGGGSGWLNAAFQVTPKEQIQMRVIICDTFDGLKDSSVLVDHFTWLKMPNSGVMRPPLK